MRRKVLGSERNGAACQLAALSLRVRRVALTGTNILHVWARAWSAGPGKGGGGEGHRGLEVLPVTRWVDG